MIKTCEKCSHCSATITWCNLHDIETDWDSTCDDWNEIILTLESEEDHGED